MANDNETVEEVCAEMRSFGDVPPPRFAWRDLADRAEAAHKHEIASLMGDMDKLLKNGDLSCVQKVKMEREIEKRNALIKELADELETQVDCDDDCNECEDCGYCPTAAQEWRKLIKKARELTKCK